MGLLFAIIAGLIVGVAGGLLLQKDYELLVLSALMGVAGAVLGDAVYFLLGGGNPFLLFTWRGLLSELIGALIFVLIFNLLHRAAPDRWGEHSEKHM